jgi:uncharacterized protein YbjT (DUF2867 family)
MLTTSCKHQACRAPRAAPLIGRRCAPKKPAFAPPTWPARAPATTTPPSFSFRPAATANDSGLPSDAEVVTPIALPAASSSFDGLRVLVVGGAGGTGREVCAALAAEGVPVTALVRSASARAVLPAAAAVVTGDVTRYSSLATALSAAGDFNAVVWAAGSNSLAGLKRAARSGGPLGLARGLATAANPLAARAVELGGIENFMAALGTDKAAALKSFVLVSSIGADDPIAQVVFPALVLFWKKRAEETLQRSALGDRLTIVRPGGLKNESVASSSSSSSIPTQRPGSAGLVMTGPDGIGLPPGRRAPGSISRAQVADVCVAALVTPGAAGKVVEVVAEKGNGGGGVGAARRPWADLFAGAAQ